MGRQKKNELDAILEQLKKSYATDDGEEINNSSDDEEKTDNDIELASALEKIFASAENKDEEVNASENNTQELPENIENVQDEEEAETLIEEDSAFDANDQERNESESGIVIDSIDEECINSENDTDTFVSDEERVDDVLSTMLRLGERDEDQSITCDESGDEEETTDSYVECDEEVIIDLDTNDETDISITENSDDNQDQANTVAEQFPSIDELPTDEENLDRDAKMAEDAEDEEQILVQDHIQESDENDQIIVVTDDVAENDLTDEMNEAKNNESDYTFDELQADLESLYFYKPEKDLSKVYLNNTEAATVLTAEAQSTTMEKNDTDNAELQDVSLLMKFGYGTDSGLGIRKESVRDVMVERNKDHAPDNKRIIHGFIGKEYALSSQREDILKKFRRDKIHLLVLSIIVSMLSVTMCGIDLLSAKIVFAGDYIRTLIIGIAAIVFVSAILGKRFGLGVLNVLRSEYDPYSWICFIHIGYVLYSVVAILIIDNSIVYGMGIPYFSLCGYVLICTSLTVWAEYIDCCREMNTFEFISSDGDRFVAEKEVGSCHSTDKSKSDVSCRYSIRRTHIVSGFFKRISDNSTHKANNVITMSLMFVVAVLIGISVSIITGNALNGAHSVILTLLSTTLLSLTIAPSLIDYFNYMVLRRKNSVFIGSDSVCKYSKIDSVSFNDTEALEIVSVTEINPDNESDNPKKWANIANNIFVALGGPVSEFLSREQESNVDHDIIINSISENGIDLYFDSSVNVLLGDAQYMLYHNIRVRTDIKLTTAVKGADKTVIYVAFDGVPRVGYIITSKIKTPFVDMLKILNRHSIRVFLNSYEPEVNESYFELNKIDLPLTVNKPNLYENITISDAADSGIVSDTTSGVCRAFLYGNKMIKDNKRNKINRIIQSSICFVASLALTALCYVFSVITHSDMMLLFYLASIFVLIPNIIQIIEILRRK